ncbi:MAG: helix-turn-helix domain-containing protein, partial [Rhodothermales bacterium]|nr:helix-turn-helix domain-containing protein [Rhodothermales bacterium]
DLLTGRTSATAPVIVSTASRDLMGLARSGAFEADLAHRLGCVHVAIAPLRERPEDVQVVIDTVLRNTPHGTPNLSLTPRAARTLRRYSWPGNDRELAGLLDRLRSTMAVDPSPVIDVQHLPENVRHEQDSAATLQVWMDQQLTARNGDLDEVLAHAERILIESTLSETSGQVTAAADLLGLTRQGLYKKMKRLDVDPGRFHETVGSDRQDG